MVTPPAPPANQPNFHFFHLASPFNHHSQPDITIMTDEITDIKPSDVEFLEELREGKYSSIFKVLLRGRLCAMKVVSELALHLCHYGESF